MAKSSSKIGIGVMGMGPNPLGYNNKTGLPYPFILSTMAEQGVIKSPAFSLSLKGLDSQSGTKLAAVPLGPRSLMTGTRHRDLWWCRQEEIHWLSRQDPLHVCRSQAPNRPNR